MPSRNIAMWPTRILMGIVKGYRLFFSAWLGSNCRFSPSCSAYSLQALETFGAGAGTYLTLRRLARCHPWCEGGEDPVPGQRPRLFAGLPNAAAPRAETATSHLSRKLHP
jgi:uncharacterized protein